MHFAPRKLIRASIFWSALAPFFGGCEPSSPPEGADGSSPGGATTEASATQASGTRASGDSAAARRDASSQRGTSKPSDSAPTRAALVDGKASGLTQTVLSKGSGSPPAPGASVLIHCVGWTVGPDGGKKEFLNTREAGAPQRFVLTRDRLAGRSLPSSPGAVPPLIDGLTVALLEMKPGERREVRVPSELAYGRRGYPRVLPGGEDLHFDVELVSVDPPAER